MGRQKSEQSVVVFGLGSLTAYTSLGSCHACGRGNQGLTFTSKRRSCRGAAITVCTLCLVDAMAYHRDYLQSQRKDL